MEQPTPESYFKTCQPDVAVRREQTTTAARRIHCQPVRKYAFTTKKKKRKRVRYMNGPEQVLHY